MRPRSRSNHNSRATLTPDACGHSFARSDDRQTSLNPPPQRQAHSDDRGGDRPRTFNDDPDDLTPDERLREVASILAEGFRRMRRRPALAAPCDQNPPQSAPNSDVGAEIPPESAPDCLELSAASRPDGVVG